MSTAVPRNSAKKITKHFLILFPANNYIVTLKELDQQNNKWVLTRLVYWFDFVRMTTTKGILNHCGQGAAVALPDAIHFYLAYHFRDRTFGLDGDSQLFGDEKLRRTS